MFGNGLAEYKKTKINVVKFVWDFHCGLIKVIKVLMIHFGPGPKIRDKTIIKVTSKPIHNHD